MSRTIRDIGKNRKVPGAGMPEVDWIAKSKVAAFKTIFDKIRSEIGGYDKARDYIGLSAHTLDGLEKGRISAATARKILDAHNNLFAAIKQ